MKSACSTRCETARKVGPIGGSPPATCRQCGTVLIVEAAIAAGTGFWRIAPGEAWTTSARLRRVRHVARVQDLVHAEQEPGLEPSVHKAIKAQRRALEAAARLRPETARRRMAKETNPGVRRLLASRELRERW